jgi:hypothetical protein
MATNKGKGLIKTSWDDIRERVSKVEPQFAKIVDSLSPDQTFAIYLAYYPYGSMDADTISSFFPKQDGSFYRLTDNDAPKEVCKDLGYSKSNVPFGMVLEKQLELFADFKQSKITVPLMIYTPGMFFPFAAILSIKNNRVYAPNGILSSTAGARSVFMLPKISCVTNHIAMQRDLDLKTSTPRSLYDHWYIFKEISDAHSDWNCCIIYFSEKWITKLHSDHAWIPLKNYLHELAWKQYEYERNRIYYDMTFSMIQNHRNLKPNPYLADTAKHLFATASGAAPGYLPALNDDALPLTLIQEAYTGSYGLKKYYPTVMRPAHYTYEKNRLPIYYSLQHPSTYISSPKSRQYSTTLLQLLELEHIMRIFSQELAKKNQKCNDTILGEIAKHIEFSYYHSSPDKRRIVKSSYEITKIDNRFLSIPNKFKKDCAEFAGDAPFLRGCICINSKN